jgi:hypothetical protein
MLKLTYTDFGLHLERVTTSVEAAVAQRVVLAMRMGQTLHVEPSRAAFLLPIATPGLDALARLLRVEQNWAIAIDPVDDECVEVCLQGSWIAATADAHEGMFVVELSEQTEFFVYRLWKATQVAVTV